MKTKKTFLTILALVSILGFLTTAVLSFLNFDLSGYATSVLFILIGFGLMVEGNIRGFIKMSRNGFTSDEVSHITAIVVGLLAVITGTINLVGSIFVIQSILQNDTFSILKGILSVIAIFVISIETWLVN